MNTLTYEFDEIELEDGLSILAAGSATIRYDSGGGWDITGPIKIDGTYGLTTFDGAGKPQTLKNPAKLIDEKHWAYRMIRNGLQCQRPDHIQDQVNEALDEARAYGRARVPEYMLEAAE